MKSKDLFAVILKIFGIYLIKDVLLAVPPVLSEIIQMLGVSADVGFFSLIFYLIALGIRIAIVYFLLFKTNYIISKLSLTSGISEEPLQFNMHRSAIYTIAIIIAGIVILAFAIPNLVKHVYLWYEFMDARKRLLFEQRFDFSGLVVSITEVIIGLLLLGNQRIIVNYIELRKRKSIDALPKV